LKQIKISGQHGVFFGPKAGTALVHAEHEALLNNFIGRVEKYGRLLLGLLGLSSFLLVLLVMAVDSINVVGLYLLFLSALIYAFPFVTPMTIDIYGVAGGVRIARALAAGIAIIGLLIFVF
jgi:hypothetical protein